MLHDPFFCRSFFSLIISIFVSQPLLLNYSHNTCSLNLACSFNLACLFEVGQEAYCTPTEMGKCKGCIVCKLDEVVFAIIVAVIVVVIFVVVARHKQNSPSSQWQGGGSCGGGQPRQHGQSRPPCSLGWPLTLRTNDNTKDEQAKEERGGGGR